MKRDLQPHELIERSIIKKFRKTIWNPFTLAVRQYQLIQPCAFRAARIPC